jgi:hypothetical protein
VLAVSVWIAQDRTIDRGCESQNYLPEVASRGAIDRGLPQRNPVRIEEEIELPLLSR